MTYGERIKQGREEKGLTQEQLAESLDVSRQAVSKWEMDLSRPARGKLARLSEVLEIPEGTWAAIDAEQAAASRPRDSARPWKIAAAVLAALCLALGGILIAGWLAYVNIRVPSESVQGEVSIPVEAAGPPEAAFPETLPLKSRRDFDFGDWPLGECDRGCVSFLDDPLRLEDESLWQGKLKDGGWLQVVKTDPRHEKGESGAMVTFYNLYLLYAPEAGDGPLEWSVLTRLVEENVYLDTFSAEKFYNVLGYDGWKLSVTVGSSAGALNFYFSQRPDGTPCLLTVGNNALEADVDEDGTLEIVSVDEVPLFCEIVDTADGEEGALVYTLDPYTDGFANVGLSFAPAKGGFVTVDSHNAVLARYVLRDRGLERVPRTDFSATDYPDAAATRIEFITDDPDGLSDGLDPDNVLYNGKVRISHRQQAYLALQDLYSLMGLKVDFCYCAANEYGVLFSLLPDGFNQRSFFAADFGEEYGGRGIPQFRIAWRELDNDWSPLSLTEAVLPEAWVPPETVLGWYYERLHIFRAGEAAVETGGDYPEERKLYLENGDLFVGRFRDSDWGPVLTGLIGPYPDGKVNH